MLDVGLCCPGALRGLWGFCVREWLGGLKACGVFAFVFRFFSVFALLLSFCPCVSVSALLCLPSCLVFVGVLLGFLFPFRMYRQKERARRVGASSLGVLWVALFVCCFVLLELGRTQAVNIVTKFYI